MEQTNSKKTTIITFIKAGVLSVIIALVLVLLFAFILKWTNLGDNFIMPINLVIKAISICVGTILLCKNGQGGLIKGLILGVIFALLSFLIFSVLNGSFNFGLGLLVDILFCSVSGAIVGILAVNLKKA
ncbi:MAG: TIGR04086 family membrane protein [Clostridia bacterium]|nr:TIGR04086 family membrane protein [Clostridia bacterium]